METKIYNLIILDASGSMETIKEATINGFNETVQTVKAAQKKFDDQKHLISLVVFNSDDIKTVYDCVPAEEVHELNDKNYKPNCCTPLFDAIGIAVSKLQFIAKEEDKVLVTIITDGYENASKEYSGKLIKEIIDKQKEKGWVFTYIGANQDSAEVAAKISIYNTINFDADNVSTHNMFVKESTSRMKWFDRVSKKESKENLQNDYFEDEDK